jgi:hypothetical protein
VAVALAGMLGGLPGVFLFYAATAAVGAIIALLRRGTATQGA